MKRVLTLITIILGLFTSGAYSANPAETVTHWVDYRVMPTYYGVPLLDTNVNTRLTALESQTNSYASLYSLNQLSNRVVVLEGQTNSYAFKSITNDINSVSTSKVSKTTTITINGQSQELSSNINFTVTTGEVSSNDFNNVSNRVVILEGQTNDWNSFTNKLDKDYTNHVNALSNSYAPMSITNDLATVETNLQDQVNNVSNNLTGVSNQVVSLNGQTNTWNDVTNKLDKIYTNNVNALSNNYANINLTNNVANLEGRTNDWNSFTNKTDMFEVEQWDDPITIASPFTLLTHPVLLSAFTNIVMTDDFLGTYTVVGHTLFAGTNYNQIGIQATDYVPALQLGSVTNQWLSNTNELIVTGAGSNEVNGTFLWSTDDVRYTNTTTLGYIVYDTGSWYAGIDYMSYNPLYMIASDVATGQYTTVGVEVGNYPLVLYGTMPDVSTSTAQRVVTDAAAAVSYIHWMTNVTFVSAYDVNQDGQDYRADIDPTLSKTFDVNNDDTFQGQSVNYILVLRDGSYDGQTMIIRVHNGSNPTAITLPGYVEYGTSPDSSKTVTFENGAVDYIGLIYRANAGAWSVVSWSQRFGL